MSRRSTHAAFAEGKAYLHRQRHLKEAEAQLRQKQADLRRELRLHEQLQRQLTVLESVVKEDSLSHFMHRMALRGLAAQEAARAEQGAAAAPRAASQAGLATNHPPQLNLEDFPLSLSHYNNQLLQRTIDMTLDNYVRVYRTFVERVQPAITHVKCHGQDSHMWRELSDTVNCFANLVMVCALLKLRTVQRMLKLNCLTLEEREAPPGWYTRVAQLIPVHPEFVTLVRTGMECVQSTVDSQLSSNSHVLQRVQQLISSYDPSAQPPGSSVPHLDEMDNLLDRCTRCADSIMLPQTVQCTNIFAGMRRLFDVIVVGEVLSSCWPYSIRAMPIFEAYLQRADVQAALEKLRTEPAQPPTATELISLIPPSTSALLAAPRPLPVTRVECSDKAAALIKRCWSSLHCSAAASESLEQRSSLYQSSDEFMELVKQVLSQDIRPVHCRAQSLSCIDVPPRPPTFYPGTCQQAGAYHVVLEHVDVSYDISGDGRVILRGACPDTVEGWSLLWGLDD